MHKWIYPLLASAILAILPKASQACSVMYYVDARTGDIYVVNHEDYWCDVEAYIQVQPARKNRYARLWYGWDDFAQGGINEKGLFFDAAVTPEQEALAGYGHPTNNLGDKLLAHCATVEEALAYLEEEKIALTDSHMMFGDRSGTAVVVEWVAGERVLHWRKDHQLVMTNFLLSDPEAGNYPCPRFASIQQRIQAMEESTEDINLLKVGNVFGQAAQPPQATAEGRESGTVYTTFINITESKFYLSYRLSNENVIALNLEKEFAYGKKRKIPLKF